MHSGGDLNKLVFDAKNESDLKTKLLSNILSAEISLGTPSLHWKKHWPKLLAAKGRWGGGTEKKFVSCVMNISQSSRVSNVKSSKQQTQKQPVPPLTRAGREITNA